MSATTPKRFLDDAKFKYTDVKATVYEHRTTPAKYRNDFGRERALNGQSTAAYQDGEFSDWRGVKECFFYDRVRQV